MRIKTKLMNAADSGGPGAAPADLASVLAGMAKTLEGIQATMASLPATITESASKAVNGALTKRDRAAAEAAAKAQANKPTEGDGDEGDDEDPTAGAAGKQAPGHPPQDPAAAKALREAKKARAELDRMRKQLEDQAAAAAAERKAIESREDRAALQAVLATRVRPELLESAVALHTGRLHRPDGATAAVWRDGDDEMDLDAGVAKWLSTPAGKAHLPPVDTKGSGAKTGSVDKHGQRVYSDADLGRGLMGLGQG